MPITLETFVRFTCFNFCLTALDSYFHSVITAGASDPYKRQNSATAGSYRQPCLRLVRVVVALCCTRQSRAPNIGCYAPEI